MSEDKLRELLAAVERAKAHAEAALEQTNKRLAESLRRLTHDKHEHNSSP